MAWTGVDRVSPTTFPFLFTVTVPGTNQPDLAGAILTNL